jgi:colanic acid/amylovoran biosynthesis glycosyltransferase
VLAGDGELRGAIEGPFRRWQLADHVRSAGWIDGDRVREEIFAAPALVLPSFAEGLAVVEMEAMALCRPVPSTFIAGIPELVRDGIDGWRVPAGDIDALVRAMRACLAAEIDELRDKGSAARARMIERHIDVEADKLARLFSDAASQRAHSP